MVLAGERTTSEGKPIRNQILAGLPHSEFHMLRPFLEGVELPARTSLHDAAQIIDFAYFPSRGLVSLIVAMKDGKTVEVGVVGEEGLIGVEGIFGISRTPYRSVLAQNGEGVRISLVNLRPLLPSLPQFRFMVSRYLVARTLEMAQWAACNRLHTAEQRLARWLLGMLDRMQDDSLRVTHDFLAAMLGTDRPSISLAAGVLRQKGGIAYSRGTVKVLDRHKLEESVCECYGVIQRVNGPQELA
jgi:CRP-like cAMP-binding protein